MVLCEQHSSMLSCFTNHASSLRLPYPPLFSLTISKNQLKQKQQEQVTKTFSRWKQVHVGMEPSKTSQTRWEWHHNTFIPSLHLVPFCKQCPTKKLSTHSLNEHGTQHCSLHSLPHKRQPISATFSSNKISQHNVKLSTYHTDPALLMVDAYKKNYTCHAH